MEARSPDWGSPSPKALAYFAVGERYDRQYQQQQDALVLAVAIALYWAAISADPSYAKAWNNRGVLRLRQGDAAATSDEHETADEVYKAAIEDLLRAADLDVAYAYNLGMAWGQYARHLAKTRGQIPGVQHAIEEARAAFDRVPADEGNGRSTKVKIALASVEALLLERKGLAEPSTLPPITGPDTASLHYLAARMWARLGKRDGAKRELAAATKEQPDLESLAMNDPDLRPAMVDLKGSTQRGQRS